MRLNTDTQAYACPRRLLYERVVFGETGNHRGCHRHSAASPFLSRGCFMVYPCSSMNSKNSSPNLKKKQNRNVASQQESSRRPRVTQQGTRQNGALRSEDNVVPCLPYAVGGTVEPSQRAAGGRGGGRRGEGNVSASSATSDGSPGQSPMSVLTALTYVGRVARIASRFLSVHVRTGKSSSRVSSSLSLSRSARCAAHRSCTSLNTACSYV